MAPPFPKLTTALLLLLLAVPTPARSQAAAPDQSATPMPSLVSRLRDDGFENLSAERAGNTVYVKFENRVYRWEVEGLGYVLAAATEEAPEDGTIVATAYRVGVPIYRVEVPVSEYRSFLAGTLSPDDLLKVLRISVAPRSAPGRENRSFLRADVTYGFGLQGTFTTIGDQRPTGIQVRPRVGIEGALLPGLFGRAQEWFTLNDAGYGTTRRRPARGLGSYTANLGGHTFFTAEAGRFLQTYTGQRGTIAHLINGGADSLYAEVARVRPSDELRNRTETLATWRHKFSGIDATLIGRYGKFIYGDTGYSVALDSAFKQSEFIFTLMHTTGTNVVSAGVVLPLAGHRYPRPRPIRFRPEESFNYTYRSSSDSKLGFPIAASIPDIPFTDDWRVLMMPAYLKDYVGYLRPGSIYERLQRGVEERTSIGPSLSGSTGLLGIPTADVEAYGSFSTGFNYMQPRYRRPSMSGNKGTMAQYFTLGILPGLELTVRLTNGWGKLFAQRFREVSSNGQVKTGWNVDRMASLQWLILRETKRQPALAAGIQDMTPDLAEVGESVLYRTRYGVVSKHFGGLGIHAGYGTDRLHGLFAGADYKVAPNAWLMADYGDHKWRNTRMLGRYGSAGARLLVSRHFQFDVFLPDFRTISGGFAYRSQF